MTMIPEWIHLPTMDDFIIAGIIIFIFFCGLVIIQVIYYRLYLPWQEKKDNPPSIPQPPPKMWTDQELYELRQENSWGKLRETTGLTQGQLQHRIQRYKKEDTETNTIKNI